MSVRLAINGLGRVGRALLRIAEGRPALELVAVHDLEPAAVPVRLVARDTVRGRFDGSVTAQGDALVLNGRRVPVFREASPATLPWAETGARLVVEATDGDGVRER